MEDNSRGSTRQSDMWQSFPTSPSQAQIDAPYGGAGMPHLQQNQFFKPYRPGAGLEMSEAIRVNAEREQARRLASQSQSQHSQYPQHYNGISTRKFPSAPSAKLWTLTWIIVPDQQPTFSSTYQSSSQSPQPRRVSSTEQSNRFHRVHLASRPSQEDSLHQQALKQLAPAFPRISGLEPSTSPRSAGQNPPLHQSLKQIGFEVQELLHNVDRPPRPHGRQLTPTPPEDPEAVREWLNQTDQAIHHTSPPSQNEQSGRSLSPFPKHVAHPFQALDSGATSKRERVASLDEIFRDPASTTSDPARQFANFNTQFQQSSALLSNIVASQQQARNNNAVQEVSRWSPSTPSTSSTHTRHRSQSQLPRLPQQPPATRTRSSTLNQNTASHQRPLSSTAPIRHPIYGWDPIALESDQEKKYVDHLLQPFRDTLNSQLKHQQYIDESNHFAWLARIHAKLQQRLHNCPIRSFTRDDRDNNRLALLATEVREKAFRDLMAATNSLDECVWKKQFSGTPWNHSRVGLFIQERTNRLAKRNRETASNAVKRSFCKYMRQYGRGPAAGGAWADIDPYARGPPVAPRHVERQMQELAASPRRDNTEPIQIDNSDEEEEVDAPRVRSSRMPPPPDTPPRVRPPRQRAGSAHSSHNRMARFAMTQSRAVSENQGTSHGSESTESASSPVLNTPTRSPRRISRVSLSRGMLDKFNAQTDATEQQVRVETAVDQSTTEQDNVNDFPIPIDPAAIPLPEGDDDLFSLPQMLNTDLDSWEKLIDWDGPSLDMTIADPSTAEQQPAGPSTPIMNPQMNEDVFFNNEPHISPEPIPLTSTPTKQGASPHGLQQSPSSPQTKSPQTPQSLRKRRNDGELNSDGGDAGSESAKRRKVTPMKVLQDNELPGDGEMAPQSQVDTAMQDIDELTLPEPDWLGEHVADMESEV